MKNYPMQYADREISVEEALEVLDEGEFITSMKEFRSHKRPSSIMSHIAEGYSDEEFERMARYFNGIRIKGDVK